MFFNWNAFQIGWTTSLATFQAPFLLFYFVEFVEFLSSVFCHFQELSFSTFVAYMFHSSIFLDLWPRYFWSVHIFVCMINSGFCSIHSRFCIILLEHRDIYNNLAFTCLWTNIILTWILFLDQGVCLWCTCISFCRNLQRNPSLSLYFQRCVFFFRILWNFNNLRRNCWINIISDRFRSL